MLLSFDHVTKRYDGASETVDAVVDASLVIESGEVVVLLGPSGSGKSTLLLLAAGALTPDAGTVSFNSRDLAAFSSGELSTHLREHVGVAYQSPHLLEGHDALSNVAIKLLSGRSTLRAARSAALPVMGRLGLSGRIGHFPGELSGGEQRRVALARAIVGAPALLLLDEPTANLDTARVQETLDLIARAAADGAGVLLVTHDEAALRIASRVRELRDGRLTVRPLGRAA